VINLAYLIIPAFITHPFIVPAACRTALQPGKYHDCHLQQYYCRRTVRWL